MFSFHIPEPDFFQGGEASNIKDCFRKMCERAEGIYGLSDRGGGFYIGYGRYAAGEIYDCSLKEVFKGNWTEIIYCLRIKNKWYLVSKDLFDIYADKFIGQMPEITINDEISEIEIESL